MMAIKETFGNIQVLILGIPDPIEVLDETHEPLETTSVKSPTETLRTVLRSIAEGFSADIGAFRDSLSTTKLEIEFAIGFSESANMWVIGVKGDQKISVKMIWESK